MSASDSGPTCNKRLFFATLCEGHLNSDRKIHSEEVMVHYLLGELAEEDRVEFEDACFADDRQFEELLAVEAELTDDYVRGHLVGQRRERFEEHLSGSPEGKYNLEFARIITGSSPTAPQATTSIPGRRQSNWILALGWLDLRGRVFQISLGALALILLAFGLWLFWSTRQTRSHQEQAVQEPPPAGQHPQQSEQTPDPSAPPGSQAAATPELPKQPNNGKQSPPNESLAIVSLLVVPGFERSAGGANDLIIPSHTRRVRLQLALEGNKHQNYRAVLRSVEGKEIFARHGLKARLTLSGRAVTLELPAHAFPQGDFILTLSGTTSEGEVEDLHKYFLNVSRK